jgi:hypothetical protein
MSTFLIQLRNKSNARPRNLATQQRREHSVTTDVYPTRPGWMGAIADVCYSLWLNALAPLNMAPMSVTSAVLQLPIGWLAPFSG